MSRVAKNPIILPSGVDVVINGQNVEVKGAKGALSWRLNELIGVEKVENTLKIVIRKVEVESGALAGTSRALLNNMVQGVHRGYEKKLQLVGVGYRAKVQGKVLNLTLGLSHPVNHPIPDGITIDAISQTEIVVKGVDKQKVGQVAADIRSYRPPEPYKGKGIRYADETVKRKEAKKK